jgi:hypothetical protein
MLYKDYDRKFSVAKKKLVVSLKGLRAKKKETAVSRQSNSNPDSDSVESVESCSCSCEKWQLRPGGVRELS